MSEFIFTKCSKSFPKCQGIYAIKGKYNNFHLVGQTFRPMGIRWMEHRQKLRQNKHDNSYLQNSYNKHGEENFCFVFLEECHDAARMNERECFWIKHLDSMKTHKGWNLREGGAYGLYGPELRKRVSEGIRKSSKALASREARAKTFTLRSPHGDIITFTNLRKFCKKENLSPACLWRLFNGKNGVKIHKGWSLP